MKTPRSLQARLLVLMLGLVLALWGLTAALVWWAAQHELDELLDGHLAQAAALLVLEEARVSGAVPAPAASLNRYAARAAFQVWQGDRLVLRSANAPGVPMSDSGAGSLQTLLIDGRRWRVFHAQGATPDVQVYVGERTSSRTEIVSALLIGALLPLLLVLPLLGVAAWWAVRRGTAPLRELGSQLAARAPQALHAVALADTPTEMLPLLSALNRLFERIAAMMDSERRFTADAAHELRTPIAAIRTQAQVALIDADDGRRRHALEATIEGCDRATRLVEQLLALARLESGPAAAAAPVDLGGVVRRVAADLAPRALGRQQRLEVEAEAACPVAADPTLLAMLVRNLVDNALRYSPAGASVNVLVCALADGVGLSVEDSGPGLVDADRQRLGERFFRVLGSGESGSGLGWSIVRRIAAVLGADVVAERSAALGGLAVRVRLPLP
jgi:two-component system sensor histidine kinase QseC